MMMSVKSAGRLTEGVEEKDTEYVVIVFIDKKISDELILGFVEFSLGEHISKPMRCCRCQEFVHLAKNSKE